MILIISTCADKLSELEFVRPIAMLFEEHIIQHYSQVKQADIKAAEKIIMFGANSFNCVPGNRDIEPRYAPAPRLNS